jgi:hypothetical protein
MNPTLRADIARNRTLVVDLLRAEVGSTGPPCTETASWRLSSDGPGWAVVSSALLGEDVLWLRDEGVVVPHAAEELVSYTRAELEILGPATERALRDIHQAKKLLGCRLTNLKMMGT